MNEIVDRLREARGDLLEVDCANPGSEARLDQIRDELAGVIGDLEGREGQSRKSSIEFAKVISVKRDGGRGVSLRIDGLEFPWYVHEDGVSVGQIRKDDVPSVLVPIIAERVEVIDSIDTVPATLEDDAERQRKALGLRPDEGAAGAGAERHEIEGERVADEEPGIVRPGRDR